MIAPHPRTASPTEEVGRIAPREMNDRGGALEQGDVVRNTCSPYQRRRTDTVVFLIPALLCALFYGLHATSPTLYGRLTLPEHFNPGWPILEWLQVGAYLGAAFLSARTGVSLRKLQRPASGAVCGLLALGCLFVALEEISYGQHILGFTPSARLRELNFQAEINLHNLNAVQPYLHRAYIACGLLGAFGWIFRWRCAPLSLRDLVFVEARFALFFAQLGAYYYYLEFIDPAAWNHQEVHEAIAACGVVLFCRTRDRRARALRGRATRGAIQFALAVIVLLSPWRGVE